MHYQSDDNTHIMFSESTSGGKFSWVPEDGNSSTDIHSSYGSGAKLYVNGVDTHMVFATNTRDQVHTVLVTDGASHSKGAIVVHEDADTSSWSNFKWSRYGGARYFNGKMTEMVLYNTDQSANREDIEKDMALHSGAYQVEDAPLLDAYGGAHAAYSLRKLNSDYTGAAIRVVSVTGSSPYDEQDIGFDANGNLDEAALKAFAQNNCVIKTWYDQSGNGNDVTQTSVTDSPRIMYSSGALTTVEGRPAALFEGTSDALPFDNTGLDIGNLLVVCCVQVQHTIGDSNGLPLKLVSQRQAVVSTIHDRGSIPVRLCDGFRCRVNHGKHQQQPPHSYRRSDAGRLGGVPQWCKPRDGDIGHRCGHGHGSNR